jgi:DNA mismatch endonuclease (patch repair protein)
MRAIKAFGTKPEHVVEQWIRKLKISCTMHDHKLPGRPDFVFRRRNKVVLVHGDFWHGWRYPSWKGRLPKTYWRDKIERNRRNDVLNRRRLRRLGWSVLILWEHQIRRAPEAAFEKLQAFLCSGNPAAAGSSK